ncbi:dynamin family protein [Sulfurovum sp.]|uniref:dynamin family protein n=1 Tax=Sulfurovum sp. TaxID=1969726 RepID=UPI0025F98F86|nr:dynamin family protein [Sulfurovum sp.]
MQDEDIFSDVFLELDELEKFFKFNRKAIASSIKEALKEHGYKHSKLKSVYEELDSKHNNLTQKHQTLSNEHREVITKYDLVSNILGAEKIDNQAMIQFEELIKNDFLEFANQESSLAEEAQALLMMQNIQRELQIISSFPSIYNKTIVAVGGGFSAGKSEFISSFFDDKTIKLPIGIKPVTAIPTYISNGNKHVIKGYSYKGGSVNISSELYADLSHDFIKSFSFNLKDIVPMMAIETKIKNYKNICFIDTPGYNPTNTGTTDSDHQTANEYLENANVLLWMIGLDASDGAIPASDLEFLEELSLEDKKLFIVANKADLKSPNDLEEILDSFEDMLDEYDVDYCGISAYNSIGETEVAFRKKSLIDFLQEIDSPISAKEQIISELEKVLNMYKNAISEQLKWTKDIQSDLKSLELDFMQDGMDIYESERANERLEKIREIFDTSKLAGQLKELENLRKKIMLSVKSIFKSL